MDPEQEETNDEVVGAVASLIRELPKPVQDFVTGPDRARIAMDLSKKYNLHVDQAGEFDTAYIHMLLGVSSPQEFVDTLTKAGIPPESVRGLAQDVNTQVFLPLRKAEQAAAPTPTRATQQAPVAATSSTPPLLPGSNEPVPVAPPKPMMQQPAPVVPPPQIGGYQGQQMPMYGYIPQQMPAQMMYAPPYGAPAGYGAPIYMWPQQPPVPGWQPPASQFQAPPPLQQPPMSPPVPPQTPQARTVMPSPERVPTPATQTQPKATLNAGAQIQKNYGADPYRESFTP